MPTLVTMPKWGLTMTSGTVTGWIAGEGETVTAGAPLLTVETEKAVNDVEAPTDGILRKIVAAAGTEVPVSGPVAVIAVAGETLTDDEIAQLVAAAAPAAVGAAGAAGPARAVREARVAARDESGRVNASPAARKRAQELGIDLAKVEATGPGGRVTSEDVERAAAAAQAAASAPRDEMVAVAGGLNLHALLAGPPDATPPLVFLHGLGGSYTTWTNVLGGLAEFHRVVAIDLPGHGQSDKPDPAATDYSVAGLAGAVGEAIAALGLAPAVLIGHSLGAAVALQIALDRPKLVRALVLINGAGLGSEISPELLDRVEAEPSKEEARRLLELFFEDKRLILERGVEDMYQTRLSPGADAAMKAIAALSFSREGQKLALRERLGEIDVPSFVIWGERDRVIPAAHADAASRAIPGAWLEVLPGIGHVPQVEAAPVVVHLLGEFLRTLPPAPEAPAAPEEAAPAEAPAADVAADGAAPAAEPPAAEPPAAEPTP